MDRNTHKEDIVAKVLAARGDHPGLVHIISAMEACDSYKPWHDKAHPSHLPAAGQRQMSALLFLLHRRRVSGASSLADPIVARPIKATTIAKFK
jgi:hypothetical protein